MLYVKPHISQLPPQMHEIKLYFFLYILAKKEKNMHLHTEGSVVFLNIHTCATVLRPFKNFLTLLQLTIFNIIHS